MKTPLLLGTLAALLLSLAANTGLPDWLRLLFELLGACTAGAGFFALLDWLSHTSAERLREHHDAKSFAIVRTAQALRGLTAAQTDVIARLGALQVVGRLGEEQIHWTVLSPGGKDIPLGFIVDFLWASRTTNPHLWPVRRHDIFQDWTNTEALAQAVTDMFITRGWAERATGPYAARLVVPWEEVAEAFGLDLSQ